MLRTKTNNCHHRKHGQKWNAKLLDVSTRHIVDCSSARILPQIVCLHLADLPPYPELSLSTTAVPSVLARYGLEWEAIKDPVSYKLRCNHANNLEFANHSEKTPQNTRDAYLRLKLVFEMLIGIFCTSKVFHPLLLWWTVAHWNSIARLSSSAFIIRGVHLRTSISSSPDDICIHGIRLL